MSPPRSRPAARGAWGGSLTVSKWEHGASELGGGCGAAPPAAAPHVPGWLLPLQRPGDRDTAAPAAPPLQRPAVLPPASPRKGLNLRGVGDGRAATPRENFTEPSPKASMVGGWRGQETLGATAVRRRGRLCHGGTVTLRGRGRGPSPAAVELPRPGASLAPGNVGSVLFFSFSPGDTHPTAYPNVSRRCQLLVHKCILGKKRKWKKKKRIFNLSLVTIYINI